MNRNVLLLAHTTLTLVLVACSDPSTPASGAPDASNGGDAQTDRIEVPSQFDVEGHRGARGLKPENTLPAFEAALDLGVNTLETDLHFTADNVVVLSHDPRVTKARCVVDPKAQAPLPPDPATLSPSDTSLVIRNIPLALLRKYRCDVKAAEFTDQTNDPTPLAGDRYGFPTLDELYQFVGEYASSSQKTAAQREAAARVQFNIESKRKPESLTTIDDGFDGVNPGPFERAIVESVKKAAMVARTVVQSFDARSLWAVRQLDPTLRLSLLTSLAPGDLDDAAARGASFWSPNSSLVQEDTMARARQAKLLVVPWTVNDADELRRLVKLGVDGVISDRPDLILQQIRRAQ